MKYQFSQKIDSLQPSAIREILKATADPSVISFAAGNPAPEAFPVETVQKIAKTIIDNGNLALQAKKHMDEYGQGKNIELPMLGITNQ